MNLKLGKRLVSRQNSLKELPRKAVYMYHTHAKFVFPSAVLLLGLVACGQQLPPVLDASKPQDRILSHSEITLTDVTDAELMTMGEKNPELKTMISDFIAKSDKALIKNGDVQAQQLNVYGCSGSVDGYLYQSNQVEAIFGTYCFGGGPKAIIASSARLRFENITGGQTVYDDGYNLGGNNYLQQFLSDPLGSQLYCAKGWLLVTYADRTRQQGQTDNACFTH